MMREYRVFIYYRTKRGRTRCGMTLKAENADAADKAGRKLLLSGRPARVWQSTEVLLDGVPQALTCAMTQPQLRERLDALLAEASAGGLTNGYILPVLEDAVERVGDML